jgi:PAS domain
MNVLLAPVEVRQPAVADIRDFRLQRLYEYWLAKKGQRRFPSRRDIDPIDFPYVLGHVMLVDVLRNPLRFQVRLHGTEMTAKAGYDLTGKFLDDHPVTEYRRYVMERCASLLRDGDPLLFGMIAPLMASREATRRSGCPFPRTANTSRSC